MATHEHATRQTNDRTNDRTEPPRDDRGGPGSARDAAIASLIELAERYPEIQARPPHTDHLDRRDAALAHAIYDSSVRRWLTLSHIIGTIADRPWRTLEPGMQGVLLAGSCQILLMDRVPGHAAIDQSVRWAKRNIRPGSAGFVNALLRSVGRLVEESQRREIWTNQPDELPLPDGSALATDGFAMPEEPLERLGIACGLPQRLIESWNAAVGPEAAMLRAKHTLKNAPTVLRIGAQIPENAVAHEAPNAAIWTGTRSELHTLAEQGECWVQDPTSAGTVDSVRDLSPSTVVDLCAGLGTKTKQLHLTFPDARIVASDPDPARAETLASTFAAASTSDGTGTIGTGHVEIVDADKTLKLMEGVTDLVLADVPCSNTGVLARRVEARHRTGRRTIDRLIKVQRQILRDAVTLLKPGGSILYATCSLEVIENQKQAAWAQRELGLEASRERLEEPTRSARLEDAPDTSYRDGGYSVLLTRTSDG